MSLENSFEGQFQDYFYSRELVYAIQNIGDKFNLKDFFNEYKLKEFWEVFHLSKKDKEILYLKSREKEIETVINKIVDEIEANINTIETGERNFYLNRVKDLLLSKQDYTIRLMMKDLLRSERKKEEDIENLLGMMIEDFRLGQSNVYANFIAYLFLNKSINAYQALVLFVYLIDTVCTRKSINTRDSVIQLVPPDSSQMFLISIGFSGNLFGITNVVKACEILLNDFESYEFKDESNYMTFKRNFWKYISLNKETMSSSKFNKKFECFPSIVEYNMKKI